MKSLLRDVMGNGSDDQPRVGVVFKNLKPNGMNDHDFPGLTAKSG